MNESRELSDGEARRWYKTFETSPVYGQLFDEAEIDIGRNKLARVGVTERSGRIRITYNHDTGENGYIKLFASYDTDNETLLSAGIDDGWVGKDGSCGGGTTWTYEDGEITQGEWMV